MIMLKIEAMAFTIAALGSSLSKAMEELHTTGASASERPEWRPFTIPNAISVARLACIPLFVWLLFGAGDRAWAAALLAMVGATDWVDGWFARRFDQVSELGKILDPAADRLLTLTAVLSMWIDGSAPAWFAFLTLLREGLVTFAAVALAARGVARFDVTWWGKTGTFFLLFAYPFLLGGASGLDSADILRALGWICGIPGLIISWYAAWGYVPIARAGLADARGRAG